MQIIEGLQSARVILTQRRAQRIGVLDAGPDQILMCPSQDLDRLHISGVTGDSAVIVSISGYAPGRLRVWRPRHRTWPPYVVTVAVAGGCQRINRIHLGAGCNDSPFDPQPTVGFNPDHDLLWFFGVTG